MSRTNREAGFTTGDLISLCGEILTVSQGLFAERKQKKQNKREKTVIRYTREDLSNIVKHARNIQNAYEGEETIAALRDRVQDLVCHIDEKRGKLAERKSELPSEYHDWVLLQYNAITEELNSLKAKLDIELATRPSMQ